MIKTPKPEELKTLPIRRKGDWEGKGYLMAALVIGLKIAPAFAAGLTFFIYSKGASNAWVIASTAFIFITSFGHPIAKKFMADYSTYWFGTIYHGTASNPLKVKENIAEHEAVHHWQAKHENFFAFKYIFPWPKWRRHYEAQAYALDVVRGRRTIPNAVSAMSHQIYLMTSKDKNHVAILAYIEAWKRVI